MLKIARPVSLVLLSMTLCSGGMWAADVTTAPKVGVAQQQATLKGTVTDALGPVPGASVIVKGTTNGMVTDMDGNFVLTDLKNGDIIQVSFIGYVTQEITYTGQTSLTIQLAEDTQKLEEVVVVGYGTQKKVTQAKLKKYLIYKGWFSKNDDIEITGIDGDFKSSLSSYIDFKTYIENGKLKRSDVEEIIKWLTLFGDDKRMAKSRICKHYAEVLSDDAVCHHESGESE